MSHETESDACQFTEVVVRLSLMIETTARTVAADALAQSMAPWHLALQRELLKPEEADIVESLMQPHGVAPGYEILDVIGRGGMGVVYRARQISLNRAVALKTILAVSRDEEVSIRRFEQEALTVAKLHHPNIVEALDFGKLADRWYFAMEYINGHSAQAEIDAHGCLSESIAWEIVRQSAAGLAHALRMGVTHHDIKPANIMLLAPPDGYSLPAGVPMVKITDFGLAFLNHSLDKREGQETLAGYPAGSPSYMAPELFHGDPPDSLSDIYSLGVSALELMTGERLFKSGSFSRVLAEKKSPEKIVNANRYPSLSKTTLDAILAMIAADRKDRPADYEAIIEIASEISKESDFDLLPASDADHGKTRFDLPAFTVGKSAVDASSRFVAENSSVSGKVRPEPATAIQSQTDSVPRSVWRSRLYALIPAAAIVLIATVIFALISGTSERSERATVVAESKPLFDGSSLTGFSVDQTMIGAWQAATAPDSSPAFTCLSQRGAISCALPDWQRYRITLFILLGDQTKFADIAFDRDADGEQTVVRFLANQVFVGKKRGDFGELEKMSRLPFKKADLLSRFHVLHIERQANDWYLFFEETFVGTIPCSARSRTQSQNGNTTAGEFIRLAVEQQSEPADGNGNAYFTELLVERLQTNETEVH